jgi:hypothetical protein
MLTFLIIGITLFGVTPSPNIPALGENPQQVCLKTFYFALYLSIYYFTDRISFAGGFR